MKNLWTSNPRSKESMAVEILKSYHGGFVDPVLSSVAKMWLRQIDCRENRDTTGPVRK